MCVSCLSRSPTIQQLKGPGGVGWSRALVRPQSTLGVKVFHQWKAKGEVEGGKCWRGLKPRSKTSESWEKEETSGRKVVKGKKLLRQCRLCTVQPPQASIFISTMWNSFQLQRSPKRSRGFGNVTRIFESLSGCNG